MDTRSFASGEVLMRYRRSALNPPHVKAVPPAILRQMRPPAGEPMPGREEADEVEVPFADT
jgi:hypothetical protein